MKKSKDFIMAGVLVASGFLMVGFNEKSVLAADCSAGISDPTCNKVCSDPNIDAQQKEAAGCNTTSGDQIPAHANSIIETAITVVGIIAVLVIVIGGQRFITAGGDPGKVKQAKDMILYAVVALIIAVLAYAIVAFVSGAIQSNANKGI